MNDLYTERCCILAKWLEVRNSVTRIKSVHDGMLSTHCAYKNYIDTIEAMRAQLTRMQRENPWLDDVLIALGKGI